MFESAHLLALYTDTPLHVGAGRSLGTVDLPIQRERVTHYPMIQASGIKGALRSEAHEAGMDDDLLCTIFGPETAHASDFAGALSVGDAHILLFPVRSLAGVFAWVTSLDVLARLGRNAAMVKSANLPPQAPAAAVASGTAWISSQCEVKVDLQNQGQTVELEEMSFTATTAQADYVAQVAAWIKDNLFPNGAEHNYWASRLIKKLVILNESDFTDFVMYHTEIQFHNKLGVETKTVEDKALWSAESLPVDTLLYTPLMGCNSRNASKPVTHTEIFAALTGLNLKRISLGGDETTGHGIVAVRTF